MGWRHLLEDIQKGFWGLLERSLVILLKCEGDPPSLTMNPGQMGRTAMKLRA